jgi:hypothetical protein
LNSNAYGGTEQYVRGRTERRVFDLGTPDWFAQANFGGIGDASNMSFRREVFKSWPGFNEHFGLGTSVRGNANHHAYFELIKRGYSIVYNPGAVVYHPFPEELHSYTQRSLHDLEAGFAYISYLFIEEPAYRRQLLTFLAKSTVRRLLFRSPLYPRRQQLKALIGGLRNYRQYRLDSRTSKHNTTEFAN